MDADTEVTTAVAEEPEAKPEPNSDEAVAKFVHDKAAELAATDSEQGEKPKTEGDKPAEKGDEPKKSEEKKTEAPEPFTAEQLADDAFFDKLDKAGWERLKALHPALYTMGKSVAQARGKAWQRVQELEKRTEKPETKGEEQPKRSWSPELRAAWQKKQDLDPEVAFEGEIEFAQLLAEQTKSPDDVAQENLRGAYRMAVNELPELADLSEKDLDAAVEADPDLLADLELAGTLPRAQCQRLVASVMKKTGKIVIAANARKAQQDEAEKVKKADEAKKADTQKRLKSNEQNPSKVVVESSSGAQPRKKGFTDEDLRASISTKVTEAARKAS